MTTAASSTSSPATASGPQRTLRRLRYALWLIAALSAIAFAALLVQRNEQAHELQASALPPVYQTLPAFSLLDRDASDVDLERLAGTPWVADFVFTHCPGVCPMLTAKLGELAAERASVLDAGRLRLVSISVDPDRDTPPVLQTYAEEHGADREGWHFLTGPKPEVHSLIRGGFQLVLDDSPLDEGAEAIVHSNRFVLVDRQGRVRGYYDAFEPAALDELRRDLDALLAAPADTI